MTALPPWLEPLRRQVLAHPRGHALLLHGPAGLGHFDLALGIARAWLCEGASDAAPPPCGTCPACRLVQARTHPDLHVLVPEEQRERLGWASAEEEGEADGEGKAAKKKPSRDIKVDAVRAAIAWAASTPSRGRVKVIVMHPAEAMNAVSANALLKTLEEPGASVRLVLTAGDPERLLPTIRSRCQQMRIAVPERAMALGWLAENGVADAEVMLAAAGGRPFEARDLAADGLDARFWHQLAPAVAAGDARLLTGLALPRAVAALQKLCHDALAVGEGAPGRFLPGGTLRPGASRDALLAWSRELVRVARDDEHPWNAALVVESLVAQGRQAWHARMADDARSLNSKA